MIIIGRTPEEIEKEKDKKQDASPSTSGSTNSSNTGKGSKESESDFEGQISRTDKGKTSANPKYQRIKGIVILLKFIYYPLLFYQLS